jgi:hypothetical protein
VAVAVSITKGTVGPSRPLKEINVPHDGVLVLVLVLLLVLVHVGDIELRTILVDWTFEEDEDGNDHEDVNNAHLENHLENDGGRELEGD